MTISLTSTGPSVTATALLDLNDYGTVSVLMVWIYEYVITFDEEVTFLKKSKWNTVKIFYLVCRYLPFLFVAVNTSRFLQPGLSVKTCEYYFQFISFANGSIIICAERKITPGRLTSPAKCWPSVMFLVRTYALWDRTRLALAIILVNFMALFIPSVVISSFVQFGSY
ncbi:hypothetical protein BU15DRAFT_76720 [Melanogaster broomeanus]|nr:hypothetical protein BU15DRAFT_76720 [Melanogaster broomeanus]